MPVSLTTLKRYESWFWVAVLVGVLWLRWPFIKGLYYRTTDAAAPAETMAWRSDVSAALREAQGSGRPVLVNLGATWCPWCRFMKHDVWPNPEVGAAVRAGFIPVDVDIDRDPATASRYEVDSVPTLLVLDQDGRVVRRSGFLDAGDLVTFLNGR